MIQVVAKITRTKRSMLFLLSSLALIISCNSPVKEGAQASTGKQLYRCPMHHQIVRDKKGNCPICGMDLVSFGSDERAITDVNLNILLKPTNSIVLATIPVTSIEQSKEPMKVEALG